MKQHPDGRIDWRIFVISFVVAFTCSCATSLPPVQPVRDFKDIAGKWEGRLCSPGLGCSIVVVIYREDGSGETIVPIDSLHYRFTDKGHIPMVRELADGKIRVKNMLSGLTGICTVHEGGGKRVMVYKSDDDTTTGEYEPAPK